ncbi:MAG: DUF6162 family protein [Pseudodesulfovibrio sp.]
MIMGRRRGAACCTTVVRPAGPAAETRWVLAAALFSLLVCAGAISLRHGTVSARELPEWRIDAFAELRPQELAVFNGLCSAAPEIDLLHAGEGGWPSVDALAGEFIPPFVRDGAWQRNGGHHWIRSELSSTDRHVALYVGHPEDAEASGTFLLLMLHSHAKGQGNADAGVHAPYEVWLHASPVADIPSMVTDQALIGKGWREVVARRAGVDRQGGAGQ